jgi:hypothetical protein
METLDGRVQLFAIIGSALLLFFVLEMLRRRRLGEPYALLWLVASVTLLVLSVWDDLLDALSEAVGIRTPANALFVVGFGFVLILLLSFSSVLSRLSRENKLLAQEIARLNDERGTRPAPPPTPDPSAAERHERQESPIPK